MTEDKQYLQFCISDDRVVVLTLFSQIKKIREVTIEPPEQISETLWETLAVWFPKKGNNNFSGLIYKQKKGVGSYSTVRTVLSIINTLGIVEKVPIVEATINESGEALLKKFNKKSNYEVTANYSQ